MKLKQLLLTTLALPLALTGAKAQQWSTNTLPPGLIAWWQAEDNYLDSAGAHHGSSGATFGPGRFGQAFQFSGVDQSVPVPDVSGDLNDWTQFTLEAWVKLDQTADVSGGAPGRTVINRIGNANDQVNYNQGYQFGFGFNATWFFLAFNTNGQAWPGVYTKVVYPAPLPNNVWLHIAATYDQNAVKLYLNGVPQVTNVVGAVTVRHSNSSFRIGRDDNGNCPFPGSIDDVRVYNRGLAANEIAALAATGPSLAVAQTSDKVALSWPAAYVSYDLVTRTNLSAGNWEPVTNPPATNGMWKDVSLPTADGQRFFRLKSGN